MPGAMGLPCRSTTGARWPRARASRARRSSRSARPPRSFRRSGRRRSTRSAVSLRGRHRAMDGVELEILWSNLIGIVDERAKALQRIAFSPVVREAGDLSCALFDRRGRMVAQANTGTPGHINSLAMAGAHLVRMFHNHLGPGDVLVTNDPGLSAGHFFDITVLTPIFDGDTIIAFIGSTIHHTDIGGYGVGAGARDVHEEGLWIPPLKLYERGEPCEVLHAMIRSNVRTPDAVFGDLAAQVSSGRAASDRLIGMCRRYGVPDIEKLSDEIKIG